MRPAQAPRAAQLAAGNARIHVGHLRHRPHHAGPVVEQDELIGIVTDADYVGVAINLLEQIEEIEPEEEL